jgi:signal transduction histidine kinase
VKLAQNVVKEEEPNVFKRKIELTERYDPNIPVMKLDPKLMRMVLQNLLSNAIKYTPEQGRVDISISLNQPGPRVLLTVKDTGYGIPKSQVGKIFTKLFRADNVRQMDTEGTGLGLYIVKSIVEYSGGKIWFDSVERPMDPKAPVSGPEPGTTFFVQLPLSGMVKKEGSKKLD